MFNFLFVLWHVIVPIFVFALAFVIDKKPWGWKGYAVFASLQDRILQGFSAFWERITDLKKLYIFFALIIGLFLLILFFGLYFQLFSILFNPKETKEFDSRFALAFLGTVTGGVALFTGFIAILRTETAEQGLITDRINKAVEGLGKSENRKPVIEVRIGALYALERIAQDSLRDHVRVMEVLCAYIRHNSPADNKTDSVIKLREDIQAAIQIIGRRGNGLGGKERIKEEEKENYTLDLSYCDLHMAKIPNAYLVSADLNGINLERANLVRANLKNAYVFKAKLNYADISWANLEKTFLVDSELNNAHLSCANMKDTYFNNSDLTNARIYEAKIRNACFYNTNMSGVKMSDTYAYACDFSVSKNLIQFQLDEMFCGNEVKIADNLIRPKHWIKDNLLLDNFLQAYEKWKYKKQQEL